MSSETSTQRFTRLNFRSLTVILPIVVFLGLAVELFFLNNIGMTARILFLAFCGAFLLYYVVELLTTLSVGPEGLQYKSPFRNFTITWESLHQVGVFTKGKNLFFVVDPTAYDLKPTGGDRWIFISADVDYKPKRFTPISAAYIDLHYRREVLNAIDLYFDREKGKKK